jgi:hypothetical protein
MFSWELPPFEFRIRLNLARRLERPLPAARPKGVPGKVLPEAVFEFRIRIASDAVSLVLL